MAHIEEHVHHTHWLTRFQEYLGEFVYGGMDGCVTTFAVVAGSVGADLGSSVIIILGFANLLADGFSMSVGAYLSSKSERDNYDKHRRREHWERVLFGYPWLVRHSPNWCNSSPTGAGEFRFCPGTWYNWP